MASGGAWSYGGNSGGCWGVLDVLWAGEGGRRCVQGALLEASLPHGGTPY